jgi:hypothetical protein
MRKVLDLIWGKWEQKYPFGKSEIRLDSPVKKPPDGQITSDEASSACRSPGFENALIVEQIN